MEKLISMVDYVLGEMKPFESVDLIDELEIKASMLERIGDYATFLEKPLNLGMFIPCDLGGNILVEPKCFNSYLKGDLPSFGLLIKCKEFEEAKERILFKECDVDLENIATSPYGHLSINGISFDYYKDCYTFHLETEYKYLQTIEDVIMSYSYTLELTESAIKQLQDA